MVGAELAFGESQRATGGNAPAILESIICPDKTIQAMVSITIYLSSHQSTGEWNPRQEVFRMLDFCHVTGGGVQIT